jgi:hypothetical protein
VSKARNLPTAKRSTASSARRTGTFAGKVHGYCRQMGAGDQELQLKIFDFCVNEMHRAEEQEARWFEWSAGFLLAVFGGLLLLGTTTRPAQANPVVVKITLTVLVCLPTYIACRMIVTRVGMWRNSGEVLQRVEAQLGLFSPRGGEADSSILPPAWINTSFRDVKRRSHRSRVIILVAMAGSVVATGWVTL